MRNTISLIILLFIKITSNIFYKFEVKWLSSGNHDWNKIRIISFLNHTSLFEPLFIGILPYSFIFKLSKHLIAPGASKTLERPLVGYFWKLMGPGIVSITRKKDKSWREFRERIHDDSIIVIAPEGRMKRKNGLDLDGKKMSVKSGICDILEIEEAGDILFTYSGGLHHVQAPGEKIPRIFKRIKVNLEQISIAEYKKRFDGEGVEWKRNVLKDIQSKLENNCPS